MRNAILLAACLSALGSAQLAAAQVAAGNTPMPWPPAVEKDGYLGGARGYVRFPEGPGFEPDVAGCAERNMPETRVRIALGPVSADGWLEHVDLLQCGTDKRLLRIKAPNAQLEPYGDVSGMLQSHRRALAATFSETTAGVVIHLRNGDPLLLDARMKELRYDPERTLFGRNEVLHLQDEPGLYLPYLKPGQLYQAPKGLLGFRNLDPQAGAFDRPPEAFRRRAEVWDSAAGRRYGVCGRTIDAINEWREQQPPVCGPRYRQIESRVLSWDSVEVRRATNLVILGELEDGRWEIAHAERNPAINRANYAERMGKPEDLATESERAALQPQAKEDLLARLGEVYALRMQEEERYSAAVGRRLAAAEASRNETAALWAAQQREALLADAERRRREAEARRSAVAAAIAAAEPRCWKTADCGLSFRQRYEMAIQAGDRAGAHQIALAGYAQDRTLVVEDIRRDWAGVAPGRGPGFWPEEKVHAIASRDAMVRQGIGAEIWKQAERWAAMRDYNAMRRNADNFWSQLAAMAPQQNRRLDGARPLSSLEQDYYVGRGYVVVRRPRPGF